MLATVLGRCRGHEVHESREIEPLQLLAGDTGSATIAKVPTVNQWSLKRLQAISNCDARA